MGGMAYGVTLCTRRSTTKVNIGGQEYTYDTAVTPEQRAAVQAQIRQDYLDRFAEFNPVLAAKYMFPAMQKFEEKEAVKWAAAFLPVSRRTDYSSTRRALCRPHVRHGW